MSTTLKDSDVALLLNEIAASIRAQLPIGPGLLDDSREARRVERVVETLRDQTTAGMSFADAVQGHLGHWDQAVAGAIGVGLQSNQPAESLQRLSNLILERRRMRIRVLISGIYPAMLIGFSYALLVGVYVQMVSIAEADFEWPAYVTVIANWLSRYWWLPPPLFVGLCWLLDKFWKRAAPWRRWSPVSPGEDALFCDGLAWQFQVGSPLPIMLRAAALMTGSKTYMDSAEAWAKSVERGATGNELVNQELAGSELSHPRSRIRPMVRWTVENGSTIEGTVMALRSLAESYRIRAEVLWRAWTSWIPIAAASFVCGVTAMLYMLSIIWPMYQAMHELPQ